MRLRAAVLLMAVAAWALLLTSGSAQTFRIERKDQGFLVTDRYPTGDFQVQLRLKLDAAGSILDTVGIDAAPTGSWNLAANGDGHLAFNLWDGKSWSQLLSNEAFAWGQETYVTIRRNSGAVTLFVQASWIRRTMATALSGKPIYAGDYPPDAHWGAGYNINQAAIGQIDVLYFGAPKLYPADFSDYASRIRDDRGLLTAGDRERLEGLLRTLKEKKGMEVAVAFLREADSAAGNRLMDSVAHQLRAEGKLPETYAVIGYLGDKLRLYHRNSEFDKIITWDQIKAIWDKQGTTDPKPVIMAMTLSEIAGVATTSGKKDVEVKTNTVITEGKAQIGETGGAVSAGPVKVQIPAGALTKEDSLIVKHGIATIFGESGVAINFEHGNQTLLKPAKIVFPLPAGSDPKNLVALRSLGPDSWVTLPLTIDAGSGTATATTNHFCDSVLIDLGRTKAKFLGAVGGGFGGTIILAAVGLAPTTSGAAVLVAIPFLAVGWLAGGSAYDDAQREGLDGPYPAPGFTLFWAPRLRESGPYISFLIDKTNGNFISPGLDSRDQGGKTFIGPATSAPRSTMTYISNGREFEVATSNVGELKVPVSVLGVAGELDVARNFYNWLAIETPPKTTVYVYTRLGKSKDQAKETNSGEWDGKILQINALSLNPIPPNSADSRAASCHEYWHAVSNHNGFSEMWTGAEEGIAVAMESLVWATPDGLPESNLMDDFMKLHSWVTCTPVFRSGLYTVGAEESADTRGYKQWPLLKYIYHKLGKEAFVEVIRGKMSQARLDEALVGFAIAGLISDQVVTDPAPIDHPIFLASKTRTGYERPSIIEDPRASTLKFGETDLPKATRGSVNAFCVTVPERVSGAPSSPIVVRRRWLERQHFPIPERVYVSKPASAALPQPALADLKTDESCVVLPESWDIAGRMAVMFVGSALTPMVAPATPPSNPVYVYRLTPPMGVKAEHLPTVSEADAKSRITWTPPELGGTIDPKNVIAAYRLYGRKKGQAPDLLAEIGVKMTRDKDWYVSPDSAIWISGDAKSVDIAVPRTKILGYDEFAMSSVDGLAKRDGKPLESPIGWEGGSNFLAALAKCNNVNFFAALKFVAENSIVRDNNPPQVQTVNYPISGAVNAPDVWGFGSFELKGSKLTINNGHFEFKYSGALKDPNAKPADSLLDVLNAHIASWPFNSGSAFEGITNVSLVGQIGPDGRLANAALKIDHPQFGCTINFGDMVPGVAKIDGNDIQISYMAKDAEATAKCSGQTAWMHWIYTNGSADFKMTKFVSMVAINLTFTKK